jgi:chemotaxis signal transduction protein
MARDAMHVVARVGAERFAFRVMDVEEVVDSPALLRVPNAPPGLVGQFMHRGRTVSAFDSGWMFDVARSTVEGGRLMAGRCDETALVLRVSDDRIGLLVDDVEDLTGIEAPEVRAVPAGTDPSGLLRGVWLPAGGESTDMSFGREAREASFRREPRAARLAAEARVSRLAPLVCLVNAVAVMSRGASVVAPSMAGA